VDFRKYVFSEPYFDWLCRGIAMTMVISVLSGAAAALIGLIAVRLQFAQHRFLGHMVSTYVVIFRNLPVVPLLLFLAVGLPDLWVALFGVAYPRGTEMVVLLVGLSANTGAYIAEILRAGVQAVQPGQRAAARVLGLSSSAVHYHVVLPQAVRIVAPALVTRLIHNTKNSTMAVVVPLSVGAMEMVGQAGRIAGETFSWVEPLVAVAVVYLAISIGLGRVLDRWAGRAQARVDVRGGR
jgi:His/Glu/Gln/Arg/opine family amino acid ABC transporter permease subunit